MVRCKIGRYGKRKNSTPSIMKKLLFIEDDPIVGRMYHHGLKSEGFAVDLVRDGQTGIDEVNRLQPDLVILDLMLPKVSGVQVLRHIRTRTETNALPVIVLTNAYINHMLEEARTGGANLCLTKSETSPGRLVDAVRKVLGLGLQANAAAPAPSVPLGTTTGPAVGASARSDSPAPDQRSAFWKGAPTTAIRLRTLARELIKIDELKSQALLIADMNQSTRLLSEAASAAGAVAVVQMATAVESLLKELELKPSKITPSITRTMGQVCDSLSELLDHRNSLPVMNPASSYRTLVVDDDPITLQAVNHALGRANFQAECVEDPLAAFELGRSKNFDLAVIDVQMPGMDGFELCKKLHALPSQRILPVIFLTRWNDFDHRVRSAMSGGVDFIAKPFLFMELTVKALMHVLRNQLVTRPSKDNSFQPLA